MEDQQQNESSHPILVRLPYSNAILVLGILSIVFSIWYLSILGMVLSIITLVLAKKDAALYRSNKLQFTLKSYRNLKAGRACAIIGLAVAVISIVVLMLTILGILATIPFWGMID